MTSRRERTDEQKAEAARNSRKLTDEQKSFVVQQLAGFDSAASIIRRLREEYQVSITPTAVRYYDPTTYAGKGCPERWKTLFDATRKAIHDGRAEIGIANKMVRLRWLDAMAHDAMDNGKFKAATLILAQAAREMGEGYRKRKHEQGEVQIGESDAELHAKLAAAVAEGAAILGLSLSPGPDEAGEPAGGHRQSQEPEQARDPVSG
jgi:hypothetical protein